MDINEWLRRAKLNLGQMNPFVQEVIPELPKEQPQGLKKFTRAAVRGATLGIANQDDPQDMGTLATEFVAGIPSTMAATALTGAAAPASLLRFGKTAKNLAVAGTLGEAVGAGKSIASGDLSHLYTEPLWWLAGEAAGLGIGAAKNRLTRKAPVETPTPTTETGLTLYKPDPTTEILKPRKALPQAGEVVDAEEVTRIPLRLGPRGSSEVAKEAPESSYFRSAESTTDPAAAQQELDSKIQAFRHQEEVDQILNPMLVQSTEISRQPYLPEPQPFVIENLPRQKFVRSTNRMTDDIGQITSQDVEVAPRMTDDFGNEVISDAPNIDYYSSGPVGLVDSRKLLKLDIDPKTGAKTYTPLTPETQSAIDSTALLHRQVEPSLDTFQREAVGTPESIAKLDTAKRNEELMTTNLLNKTDEEIERLVGAEDFMWNPNKTILIEDSGLAKETKRLIHKMGFSEEDIVDMQNDVDSAFEMIMKAPINQGLPAEEATRARQQLWYDLLTKRMKPC